MTRVLVTGGTGVLGRALVPRLVNAGYMVRIMSRRNQPPSAGMEWAQSDLLTGRGLPEAVAGAQTIVHAATSPFIHTRQVDIDGTRRLVEIARANGVSHFVYISIVGIERIPYYYYQHKVTAESIVASSGVPWSILRATQFHALLDGWFQPLARLPIALFPTDFKYQPIDEGEVADRLCECVMAGPSGRLSDVGGPEVLYTGDMARVWFESRGLRRRVIHLPMPGTFADALRRGYATCPDRAIGKTTWTEWVRRKYK